MISHFLLLGLKFMRIVWTIAFKSISGSLLKKSTKKLPKNIEKSRKNSSSHIQIHMQCSFYNFIIYAFEKSPKSKM